MALHCDSDPTTTCCLPCMVRQMGELEKECENGRLLRLMMKLGFVNERPELNGVRAF